MYFFPFFSCSKSTHKEYVSLERVFVWVCEEMLKEKSVSARFC